MLQRFHGGPVGPLAVPDPISTFMPRLQKRHYAYFWSALTGGIGGLIALTIATVKLHNMDLEKLFIVGGSLLIPSLYVWYLDMRSHFVDPRWRVLVLTFLLGAFVGAPIAIVLEAVLPSGTGAAGPAFYTGLIEEFAKVAAIFWLLRTRFRYLSFEMDGIILGAAAGMGFAAIEDLLYGAAAFQHGLHVVVATVWAREILGPFGHGTWTAIVVGAIWRVKGKGAPRLTASVIGAYLLAAALHGAWDWEPFGGAAGLIWIIAVGAIGITILRGMVHQALQQEDLYLKGQPPVPLRTP
ncbi:MAG: PrsW family intramembrane metalloprotease [Chloroflexota bacterium]